MVAVTPRESSDGRSRTINKPNRRYSKFPFRKLLLLFILLILFNDISLIFAKSINKPVSIPFPEENTHETLSESGKISRQSPFEPITNRVHSNKHNEPNASEANQFSKIHRTLLTTVDLSKTNSNNTFPGRKRTPYESFDDHFIYDDITFGNAKTMSSSFEDVNPFDDNLLKNFTLYENGSLANYSLESNGTAVEDGSSAIFMGIMSVVLGILILVTVIG